MTKSAHTPGPWVVGTDTNGCEVCTVYCVPTQPTEDGKGQEYVYVHYPRIVGGDFYFPTREENLANAHLIAAAPELLAALEALERHDFDDRDDFVIYNEVCRRARAAIAKAHG